MELIDVCGGEVFITGQVHASVINVARVPLSCVLGLCVPPLNYNTKLSLCS